MSNSRVIKTGLRLYLIHRNMDMDLRRPIFSHKVCSILRLCARYIGLPKRQNARIWTTVAYNYYLGKQNYTEEISHYIHSQLFGQEKLDYIDFK